MSLNKAVNISFRLQYNRVLVHFRLLAVLFYALLDNKKKSAAFARCVEAGDGQDWQKIQPYYADKGPGGREACFTFPKVL